MAKSKCSFSIGVYETMGAEGCDELAAEFTKMHEQKGAGVMMSGDGQAFGIVGDDGHLYIRLVDEPTNK